MPTTNWINNCQRRLEQALTDYTYGGGKKRVSKALSACVFNMQGTLKDALKLMADKPGDTISSLRSECENLRAANLALKAVIKNMSASQDAERKPRSEFYRPRGNKTTMPFPENRRIGF